MAVLGELVFYRRDQVDLDTVLRHQLELLRGKVDALSDIFFSEKTDEEIANHIAQSEAIQPLSVDFAAATPNVRETQVEVQDRFGFERGSVRVAGLEASKSIPFTGDAKLWHLRTNPYNLNPPHGKVQGNKLVIGISVPAQQADEAKRYIDDTVAQIPEYLARQAAQIAQHNASLPAQAMQWIRLRRERLGTASDLPKKHGG